MLVFGFYPVGGFLFPVAAASCRPAKIGTGVHLAKGPGFVNRMVGGYAENASFFENAGQLPEIVLIYKTSGGMSLFGPRVGKQKKNPVNRGVRQLGK